MNDEQFFLLRIKKPSTKTFTEMPTFYL